MGLEVIRRLMSRKGLTSEKLSEISGDEFPLVLKSLSRTHHLLTAEEVCAAGSVGPVLAAAATKKGISLTSEFLNLGEGIVCHGTRERLMRDHGIDAAAIAMSACRLCGEENNGG